ncbi:MAG: flagellar hook-length control protein FliK [Phycisphaerales bacterium]
MTSSALTATADLAAMPRDVTSSRSQRDVARRGERADRRQASETAAAKGRFADGLEDRLAAKGGAPSEEPANTQPVKSDTATAAAPEGERARAGADAAKRTSEDVCVCEGVEGADVPVRADGEVVEVEAGTPEGGAGAEAPAGTEVEPIGEAAHGAVPVPLTVDVVNRLLLQADQRLILKAVRNLGGGAGGAGRGGAEAGTAADATAGVASGAAVGEGPLVSGLGASSAAGDPGASGTVPEGGAGAERAATNEALGQDADAVGGEPEARGRVRAEIEQSPAGAQAPVAAVAPVAAGGQESMAGGVARVEVASAPAGTAAVGALRGSERAATSDGGAGRGSGTGVGLGAGSGDTSEAQAEVARVEAQVSRGVAAVMAQRGGTVSLRLQPEALGQVRVQLDWERGAVSVRFRAADEKARGLLEQTLPGLRASLEARGLDVLAVAVEPPEQRGAEGPDVLASGEHVLGSGVDRGGGHGGGAGDPERHEGAARSAAGASVIDGTPGQEAGADRSDVWLEPGEGARLVRLRVDAWA